MKEFREKYIYYALIVLLTLVGIVFLPLIGLDQNGEINLNFPASIMGWIIWAVSKGAICVVNCLIFHFFVLQGKDNIKDNADYIKGLKELNKYRDKDETIKSPWELERGAYLKKGGTVLISTAMSLFALPSLVLQFSLINFLSVLFSMIMAVSFGAMQMRETEDRWTKDLTNYVEYLKQTSMGKEDKPMSINSERVDKIVEGIERCENVTTVPNGERSDVISSLDTLSSSVDNGK